MHCEYCGKEIGDAQFCRYCGKKVLPAAKPVAWKQSIPLSIVGVAVFGALMLIFQTQGLDGALMFCMYTLCSAIWLLWVLPRQLEGKTEGAGASEVEKQLPGNKMISLANCLSAGIFGFLLNHQVSRGSLGITHKILAAIMIASCTATMVFGLLFGFLYVNTSAHFALRSPASVRMLRNDSNDAVYSTSSGGMEVLIFEPGYGSIDDVKWGIYADFGWEPLGDAGAYFIGMFNGRETKFASFSDESNACEHVIIAWVFDGQNAYELRFFFDYKAELSEYQSRVFEFIRGFHTF